MIYIIFMLKWKYWCNWCQLMNIFSHRTEINVLKWTYLVSWNDVWKGCKTWLYNTIKLWLLFHNNFQNVEKRNTFQKKRQDTINCMIVHYSENADAFKIFEVVPRELAAVFLKCFYDVFPNSSPSPFPWY